MSNLNHNLKHIMHQSLDHQNIPSDFDGLWKEYTMKNHKASPKKFYKGLILAAAITTVSATTICATQYIRRTDNINIAYQTDAALVGKWEVVDFVEKIKDFKVDKQNWPLKDLHSFMYELTFLEGGTVKCTEKTNYGINEVACGFTWTKSFILHKDDLTASEYLIKEIDGTQYMFMEWKSGDYIFGRLDEPYHYVFKKVE